MYNCASDTFKGKQEAIAAAHEDIESLTADNWFSTPIDLKVILIIKFSFVYVMFQIWESGSARGEMRARVLSILGKRRGGSYFTL